MASSAGAFGGQGARHSRRSARLDPAALDDLRLDPDDLADMPRRLAPRHAAVEGEARAG